jgi:ribose transport system permease protein
MVGRAALGWSWLPALQRYQGLLGMALLLAVAYVQVGDMFYSPQNLSNILNQLAIPGIMAIGMTFVILTGGIDLSVGATLGLLNVVTATWIASNTPLGWTALYVVALGTFIGAILGGIISVTRLQPFIVTLAAMVSLRGIAFVYTDNRNVSGLGDGLQGLQRSALGLPIPAWILIGVTLLAFGILHLTAFGRYMYAIGGNEQASRLSGVPVTKTRVTAFAINGFCVAVAAILFTARNNSGQPSAGQGYELDAITAVVVGGSSLLGGYGNVLGTFVGALFIVSLNVLITLKGVNFYVGMGWKGIIILIAVYLQNLGRR